MARMKEELVYFKRELINREENFNSRFAAGGALGATVGVMNVLNTGKAAEEAEERPTMNGRGYYVGWGPRRRPDQQSQVAARRQALEENPTTISLLHGLGERLLHHIVDQPQLQRRERAVHAPVEQPGAPLCAPVPRHDTVRPARRQRRRRQ